MRATLGLSASLLWDMLRKFRHIVQQVNPSGLRLNTISNGSFPILFSRVETPIQRAATLPRQVFFPAYRALDILTFLHFLNCILFLPPQGLCTSCSLCQECSLFFPLSSYSFQKTFLNSTPPTHTHKTSPNSPYCVFVYHPGLFYITVVTVLNVLC